MIGLGFRIGKRFLQSSALSGFTLFIDSVGGLDSNSGRTSSKPVRTLAHAISIMADNEVIALKCGSHWRESFDVSAFNNITIGVYGTGEIPIIDGSDIISSWTKTAGKTNVYQSTITHDLAGSNRLNVFENGELLTRVDNTTACDSTPGSFVKIIGSNGSPITLYIHTSNSSNPSSNGKTYEVTTRTKVIYGGNNSSISGGILTQKCGNNNGSTDFVGRTGIVVQQVLAAYGTKHNIGIGENLIKNCIALKTDENISEEPSSTMFVHFLDNASGYSALIERCGAIGPSNAVAYYAHGNPNSFDKTEVTQFFVSGVTFAGSSSFNKGSYYIDTHGVPYDGRISGIITKQFSGAGSSPISSYYSQYNSGCVFNVAHRPSPNFNEVFRQQGTGDFYQNIFFMEESVGNNTNWFANSSNYQNLTSNYNIFYNGVNHVQLSDSGVYSGNHNIFMSMNVYNTGDRVSFQWSGGFINSLSAWSSATNQDKQSVFIKREEQTQNNPKALFYGIANGINNGPQSNDYRLNTGAVVYDISGNAWTGRFPDGVLITNAGPQTYFDWNVGQFMTGTVTSLPNIPTTLSECKQFVRNPYGWTF